MKNMKISEIDKIRQHLDEYRRDYPDDILESMEYSFRVFLIPQTGNNINSADKAITFIKESDLTKDEYEILRNDITLIKNRKVPVSNANKMRAGIVVKEVNEKIDINFTLNKHTQCWKYYKVRPEKNTDTPELTNTEFCIYDSVHKDYVYTNAWVEKLIKDLSDETVRNSIFKKK